MNYKQDRINLFLYELQLLSKIEDFDQRQVYLQLVNYGLSEKEQKTNLSDIFSISLNKYKTNKKIQILENKSFYSIKNIQYKNKEQIDITNPIEIHIPLHLQNIDILTNKILDFIIKNKINNYTKISKILRNDSMIVRIYNKEDAEKIINFINQNNDMNNNMYELCPLNIIDNKVYLTLSNTLSYNDILSKYIYNYITLCNKNNKQVEFDEFMSYMYTNILNFANKDDLSKQIEMLDKKENIPKGLLNLEKITNLIYYNLDSIKNNKNMKDTFYFQYEQCNKSEYQQEISKYNDFTEENFKKDRELLKDIIITMTYKYGYNDTKKALYIYKNSKNNKKTDGTEYITNDKGLRKKVKQSKTFRTFINSYSEQQLQKEIEKFKPLTTIEEQERIKTPKEMILEEICKETYKSCQTEERNYSGKNQIAIALINIQNNNYNWITKTNNARQMAKENIKSEEVLNLIKKSLEGYIIEDDIDLYQVYAEHIEYLCNKNIQKKGRS